MPEGRAAGRDGQRQIHNTGKEWVHGEEPGNRYTKKNNQNKADTQHISA